MSSPNGPQPGSTPASDVDLHESGNPYESGERIPNDIDVRTSQYPMMASIAGVPNGNPSVAGYYFNPAPDPHNPYYGGAGGFRALEQDMMREVPQGIEESERQTYDAQQSSDWHAPDPYTDAYQQKIRIDTAQDDQFIPLDQRR